MSEVQRMVDEKRTGVRAEDFAERKDRVLIVEDEENARKGYEQLLQRWGYEVLSVGNADCRRGVAGNEWAGPAKPAGIGTGGRTGDYHHWKRQRRTGRGCDRSGS